MYVCMHSRKDNYYDYYFCVAVAVAVAIRGNSLSSAASSFSCFSRFIVPFCELMYFLAKCQINQQGKSEKEI